MASVSIHAPKTPVTKGSMGTAQNTVPNVCKMPGPPAPFVPTPLPNIGKSMLSPKGYSTSVKIEGNAVAIMGASFGSMGDIASKALGGGIISMNTHGPTKFIAPGSFTVQIEGKNVQLLSDLMSNNNGPAGSPPNSMTAVGLSQPDAKKIKAIKAKLCAEFCAELKKNKGKFDSRKFENRLKKDPSWAADGVKFATATRTRHKFMGRMRTTIPDAMLGSPPQCFDFKGPGDRWRNDQFARQTRLGQGRRPIEISKKSCGCK